MLRTVRTGTVARHSVRMWPGLAGVVALLFGFVVWTLLVAGPLQPVDSALNQPRDLSGMRPALQTLDRIGQRLVCLPILAAVAGLAAYRARSWRPVVIAAVSVFVLNGFVAVLKFSLERGGPLEPELDFLTGGLWYPSGHAANVVLVYGLAAYLWCRYTRAPRRTAWILGALVVVLTLVMITTSLTLRWHWFTDLIGGVLAGAIVLRAMITVDRAARLRIDRVAPLRSLRSARKPVTVSADPALAGHDAHPHDGSEPDRHGERRESRSPSELSPPALNGSECDRPSKRASMSASSHRR